MRVTSSTVRAFGVAFLVALSGLSACGLINSDIAKVTFDLPPQKVSFDLAPITCRRATPWPFLAATGRSSRTAAIRRGLPTVDCGVTPLLCLPNAQGMNVCTAEVTVSQYTTVDLSNVDSRLMTAKSLANISINRISYTVDSNSLNTDLPPAIIYLAPHGVTDPNDTSAKKFGTVPSIPAGTTPTGNVNLEPDAAATFSSFTRDISMSFNLIVQETLDVPSGAPVPSGAVQITVTGQLQASLVELCYAVAREASLGCRRLRALGGATGPVSVTGVTTGVPSAAATGARLAPARVRTPDDAPAFTRSFSSLPTLKKGRRFGRTSTASPVRGLRPS